jgi:hypothetical protein
LLKRRKEERKGGEEGKRRGGEVEKNRNTRKLKTRPAKS